MKFKYLKFNVLHFACVLSPFSHVQLFGIPWTVAHQAPQSMRFSRQEYWSGLSFPSPGDLPNPGIKLMFPALAREFFTTELSRKPCLTLVNLNKTDSQ